MDPRLLSYYNEELRHLREMGGEFAEQFPQIAGRLGMEKLPVSDPYVERLLEGFAFLAGRIQFKLDAEFPRFTHRLLDIVYPQFLAPTPSMLIAQFHPALGDVTLADGVTLPRGSEMSSQPSKVSTTLCEFRTAHDLTLWPLEITRVEYFTHASDLPVADKPELRKYRSGLRIRLSTTAGLDFSQLKSLADLRVHCAGQEDVAFRLHELVCGHALGALILPTRRLAAEDRPGQLGSDDIEAAGFDDDEALMPQTLHGFQGYRLLQEYFAFPQRFLFFDLCNLGEALRNLGGGEADIVILFSRADNALLQAVDAGCLALHCVPAINLLDKRCDRIQVGPQAPDLHVVPDRTRPTDFEVHTVTEVLGYGSGVKSEWRFLPFYNAFHTEEQGHSAYYTVQRQPRLQSKDQDNSRTTYIGSEAFVSLVDANEAPYPASLRQLGVRALCTNRDLPLLMPTGRTDGDLRLSQTAPVQKISVIKGPSRPQSSLQDAKLAWKLINQFTLNHLSFSDTTPEQGAAALRQLLMLYVRGGNAGDQRQVEGVRSVQLKQVVRRLPMAGPITFGRGVELRIEVDELCFEGGSAFLLGCVLERFMARHVSMNGFTQTRVHSANRGDILIGRPRCGNRPIL